MNINKLVLIAGAFVVLTGIIFVLSRSSERTVKEIVVTTPQENTSKTPMLDPRNLSYRIAGEVVTLTNGEAKTSAAPGSASEVVTQYFGNELIIDLTGDGQEDRVFLLTQDGGGSGTFFYLAAAIKTEDGYEGSEAVFIGDRIAPQSTTRGFVPGTVIVNYADRAPGESFATPPSIGKSLVLKFDPITKQFGELVVDFEGETNVTKPPVPLPPTVIEDPAPAAGSGLVGKAWQWVNASYNDGTTVTPRRPEAFTITFKEDGSFGMTTDCNGGGGVYTRNGSQLTFSEIMSTMMFCEGSQEGEFQQLLSNTTGYHVTGTGELVLDLKFDSGTVLFK